MQIKTPISIIWFLNYEIHNVISKSIIAKSERSIKGIQRQMNIEFDFYIKNLKKAQTIYIWPNRV